MSGSRQTWRQKLSPLNQRRLDNFNKNRLGVWSLRLFSVLFFISLFANFLANDRPLLVKVNGQYSWPVFFDYPEEHFSEFGFLPQTDYRDAFFVDALKQGDGWAIWPLIRYSFDTFNKQTPQAVPSPPTWLVPKQQRCAGYEADLVESQCHVGSWNWLGTDDQGRDVLARLIYGFRISVLFGFLLTFISAIIGVSAGAVQGYLGGWVDLIAQRVIEIWSSAPQLFILITIASVLPRSFWVLLIVLMAFSWVGFVGAVRAEFLRARNFEYVRAARALGVSNITMIFRHLLPNAMVATLTLMPFILSGSLVTLVSLDFLGLGLPPGSASLGELLQQGKNNLNAPWLGFAGFLSITGILTMLVFIGEAVRDALDPRRVFQ